MRINPFFMPILLIVGLLGTTFTAQALGIWSTSGRDAVDVNNLTPADIKGWMTLQQVIDGLKISQKDLYEIGGIPNETLPATALKDLEAVVSVTTLRERLTAKAVTGETHPTPLPGQILPADQIKGKNTLKEVSDQCAVPLDKLLPSLKLAPNTDPNTAIKDLISQGKLIEVTDVQKVVKELQAK